jgi:hypothetical protein
MAKEGRPSEMSEEKVKKLEEVFAIDGTVEEACFYADISKTTYYNWLEKNPYLVDRFEALRQRPFLKARQTISKSLDQPEHAKWYLERKKKKEFGYRMETEHSGIVEIKQIVGMEIKKDDIGVQDQDNATN